MNDSARGDEDALASGTLKKERSLGDSMDMNLGDTKEGERLGSTMGDTMEALSKLMMSLISKNSLFHSNSTGDPMVGSLMVEASYVTRMMTSPLLKRARFDAPLEFSNWGLMALLFLGR